MIWQWIRHANRSMASSLTIIAPNDAQSELASAILVLDFILSTTTLVRTYYSVTTTPTALVSITSITSFCYDPIKSSNYTDVPDTSLLYETGYLHVFEITIPIQPVADKLSSFTDTYFASKFSCILSIRSNFSSRPTIGQPSSTHLLKFIYEQNATRFDLPSTSPSLLYWSTAHTAEKRLATIVFADVLSFKTIVYISIEVSSPKYNFIIPTNILSPNTTLLPSIHYRAHQNLTYTIRLPGMGQCSTMFILLECIPPS